MPGERAGRWRTRTDDCTGVTRTPRVYVTARSTVYRMFRTTRWLRIVADVAAVFRQATSAVTCLDSGCTYQDLGCTYNHVWKDIDCKYLGIQGRIYIDNIPKDAKYVFLKGNPAMTAIDPRSYETNHALFLLDASCPARGCTYESLRCVWNHANNMLNCGNRNIVGEVFLTNVPKGVNY